MILIETNNKPDANWNERLLDSPYGTIYQTKELADIMKWLGRNSIFIKFISEKGKIVGQLLGFSYSRFHKKNKIVSNLGKIFIKKEQIFQWSYGPLIFDSVYTKEICTKIQEFLITKKFLAQGYEHPLLSGSLDNMGKPFKKTTWGTFLIDLSQDKNDIWKKMDKHSAIKNIERSQRKGVVVKELTRSNLDLYRQIREETNPVPLHVLEKRWDLLHEIGWNYFLAFKDNLPIGGLTISSFNGYVNEWGIARTKKDTKEKYYAQDLLKWKIIEWGINKKFKFYDLSGINPSPNNDKEKGIFRYKQKWGGKLIKFNLIDPKNQ